METRFQHILLKLAVTALATVASCASAQQADEPSPERDYNTGAINTELFELGLEAGVVNIADFTSEFTIGLSAKFRASEDFFLQYNVFQAEASESAYEQSQGRFFSGSDRDFLHYDLLLGYNVFQGEFYPFGGKAQLSSLYLLAGAGETRFGGEENFTYTLGVGYQVALNRRWLWHVDYRSYHYESSLISDESNFVQTNQVLSGLRFMF